MLKIYKRVVIKKHTKSLCENFVKIYPNMYVNEIS